MCCFALVDGVALSFATSEDDRTRSAGNIIYIYIYIYIIDIHILEDDCSASLLYIVGFGVVSI